MTSPHCDFLDHARLGRSPALRALAVDTLFAVTLDYSKRFRLEFDAPRLLAVLGSQHIATLFPGRPAPTQGPLERREEPLDHDRARLLRKLMYFGPGEWPDPPLNYIKKVVLLDGQGNAVLSASDGAEFILFMLPREGRDDLIARYRAAGIPADTIRPVDVDINAAAGPLCSAAAYLQRVSAQPGRGGP
jgi:hypothetical protein